jgi:primosomal protein N' (replication factor Y)
VSAESGPARRRAARAKKAAPPASEPVENPIARVLPLLTPAHLDRDFDYLVPPELDDIARPGVRVRVRFAGRLVDGYLLSRHAESDHPGKLVRLERVVSAEQVLTPEILRLATTVPMYCAWRSRRGMRGWRTGGRRRRAPRRTARPLPRSARRRPGQRGRTRRQGPVCRTGRARTPGWVRTPDRIRMRGRQRTPDRV